MPPRFGIRRFDFQQPVVHDHTVENRALAAEGCEQFDDEETLGKIKQLSRPTGIILITAGVAGIVIPGILGAPLLVAGGLVLAPKLFGRFDDSLKQRFPKARRSGVQAVGRFLADMEKRYPASAGDGTHACRNHTT